MRSRVPIAANFNVSRRVGGGLEIARRCGLFFELSPVSKAQITERVVSRNLLRYAEECEPRRSVSIFSRLAAGLLINTVIDET